MNHNKRDPVAVVATYYFGGLVVAASIGLTASLILAALCQVGVTIVGRPDAFAWIGSWQLEAAWLVPFACLVLVVRVTREQVVPTVRLMRAFGCSFREAYPHHDWPTLPIGFRTRKPAGYEPWSLQDYERYADNTPS